MLNVHIYPSTFEYESRILKVTRTLTERRIVDRVLVIAQTAPGLPNEAQIDEYRSVLRIGSYLSGNSFFRKAFRFIEWSGRVFLKLRSETVGMINCHSLSVLPLCVVLKIQHRAILIYEPHELETETATSTGIRKKIAKLAESLLIRWVDYFIFVGQQIKEWYVREYHIKHAEVIYNCPPMTEPKTSYVFREIYPIRPEIPIFIYQGVLDEGRGVHALIEAFSMLTDRAALVFLGYGPLTEWIIEQQRNHSNIFHHKAVPPEDLFYYTCAADYGVSLIEPISTSYNYCMPNKLFEYIMANKPVLVSSTLEQKKIVELYHIGEVAANFSPDGICNAVYRLINGDKDVYISALSKLRESYSWESQEKVLDEVYRSVISRSSSSAKRRQTQ